MLLAAEAMAAIGESKQADAKPPPAAEPVVTKGNVPKSGLHGPSHIVSWLGSRPLPSTEEVLQDLHWGGQWTAGGVTPVLVVVSTTLVLPATGILPASLFRPPAFTPSMTATVVVRAAIIVALAMASPFPALPRVCKCGGPQGGGAGNRAGQEEHLPLTHVA